MTIARAAGVALLAIALLGGASVSAASADDGDGIGITVTVSPAPTPSPSGSQGGGTKTGGSNTVVTGGDTPAPSSTPEPNESDLGGIVFVSGVSSEGSWRIDPLATEATVTFTVRNASNSKFNSTARFWIDGPIGNRLGAAQTVYILNLKPDETRVVEATITGLGQWTFLHANVTFTPPKKVDGVELEPVTRDQYFVVFPWVVGIVGILAAAAYLIGYIWRRGHGIVPGDSP